MALVERAEALADSTDWIKTADELKKLQAEWQQIGAGPASGHEGHLEALPRRVRSLLHAPQRRPDRAQGNVVGEPREEGSALRPRRGAGRVARVGQGRGRDPPAAGRMEDDRPRAPHQVGGDLAALPHRLRHVLRTLQAPRRDRARSQAGRPRRRSSSSSRRWRLPRAGRSRRRRPTSPSDLLERVRSLRTRWNQTTPVVRQGADPLSARFIDALARLMTGHPDAFKGTELDVEASRQKMEKLCARVEGFLDRRRARRRRARRRWPKCCAKRSPPTPSADAPAKNRSGARWPTKCARRRRRGAGSARCRAKPARQLTERFHKACNRFFEQYSGARCRQRRSRSAGSRWGHGRLTAEGLRL